jgi:hypothetical protein
MAAIGALVLEREWDKVRAAKRRAICAATAFGLVLVGSGCGPKVGEGPPVGVSTKGESELPAVEKSVDYAFDSLDERPVSSEAMRGKTTVIAFITTGDIVGQAQVSYLVHMAMNDADKVNYAVVALHPRKEIVLVEAYRKTLGVEFPVALGDASATHVRGPFGEIPAVPTVVVLDREGRLVWKHTGLAKNEELRGHMRKIH